MNAVCAILAAGASSRMGAQKLLVPIGGASLLQRALAAAGTLRAVAVVAPAVAHHVTARPGLRVLVNAEPERGMTRSLALADAAFPDRAAALAVILADTPFVDAKLVRHVLEALGDADVAFPVRAGRPGHPVVFGPRVRAELASWPEGDSLRRLRDDPRWRRAELEFPGDAPFFDVDTPADVAAAEASVAKMEPSQPLPKS